MKPPEIDVALNLPPEECVAKLLSIPENQWFDRKSGRVQGRDLARTLIAFANAEGGTVAVGLSDGKVDGVEAHKENDVRQAAFDYTTPAVKAAVTHVELHGLRVLIVSVSPGQEVHTTKDGTAYLRVGDESRKLTLTQLQELKYDRGSTSFDGSPSPLRVDDLDKVQLDNYRSLIGSTSIEKMLKARSLVTRDGSVTVAGALLFGKDPQLEYPHACVRILTYGDDERGLGAKMTLKDEVRIGGSLPQQIEKATEYIENAIPTWQQLADSGKFEAQPRIPKDAWLEGLVNAVVHRSYSIMGDHIRVEIYPNRLEVTSPGRFPGIVDTKNPLEITRFARNPRIARTCFDMGITRELGEGINRIFAAMRQRGLTDPIYRQSTAAVTLVLNAADAVSEEVLAQIGPSSRRLLDVLRLADSPLGTGDIIELSGFSRPTVIRGLNDLMKAGLVHWQGKSRTDPRAMWKLA